MTAVVTFVPADFKDAFPEFAACTDGQLNGWFGRAQLLFQNNQCNLAFPDGTMATLLNLLTAHIGWLNAPRGADGNPAATGSATGLVGMVKSATEGSVSVSVDIGDMTAGGPSQPYYMQTRYGIEYWAATAQYRTARYVAAPWVGPPPGAVYTGRRGVY
jgi:hypothetical protein